MKVRYMMIISHSEKNLFLSLLYVGSMLISGCSTLKNPDAPVAENYPHSMQKHVQASKHWQIIAEDTANDIEQMLANKKMANKSVYLHLQSEKTVFANTFHEFLVTSLVKKQVTVTKDMSNGLAVNYKIQPIVFNSYRSTLLPSKAKWTSLVAGILVLRGIGDLIDEEDITTPLAIAGGVDAYNADSAPSVELVITTSVLKSNVFVARNSNIYYANKTDIELYIQSNRNKSNVFGDPFYNY
jgi:hypothetical protein